MLRICTIVLLLLAGPVASVYGMDHSGHESHSTSVDEERQNPGAHSTHERGVSHDSCVSDAPAVPSMPAHGACLGCCPESARTSEAVTADRRLSGPVVSLVPQSMTASRSVEVEHTDVSSFLTPVPAAPMVLRL